MSKTRDEMLAGLTRLNFKEVDLSEREDIADAATYVAGGVEEGGLGRSSNTSRDTGGSGSASKGHLQAYEDGLEGFLKIQVVARREELRNIKLALTNLAGEAYELNEQADLIVKDLKIMTNILEKEYGRPTEGAEEQVSTEG